MDDCCFIPDFGFIALDRPREEMMVIIFDERSLKYHVHDSDPYDKLIESVFGLERKYAWEGREFGKKEFKEYLEQEAFKHMNDEERLIYELTDDESKQFEILLNNQR